MTPDPASALGNRLDTVWDVLAPTRTPPAEATPLFDVLVDLIDVVRAAGDDAAAWLLVVGLTGAYPRPGLVRSVRRSAELKNSDDAVIWLLDAVTPLALEHGDAASTLRIVSDRPLVDVTHTAGSNFLTGIQRVVRSVASEWTTHHDVELVATTSRGGAYRALSEPERALLHARTAEEFDPESRVTSDAQHEVLVPWGVPVVLAEVPAADMSDRLADIAQMTGCSLRLVGYDCIPISSAETVPLAEPEKFGRYLELVKFSDRIAGISVSAAAEFEGFTRALATQGLEGPRVLACPLPHTTPVSAEPTSGPTTRPVVACVGTIGRRKNQAALVEAAEVLWRDGLDFELRLLGHIGSERSPVGGLISELQALGRPLVVESGVSDARIAETLADSRCLVFPSLHEGFGLPVVEALSHGVPVITSDFGSLREVAEHQGCLLVDPEDVDALITALRAVLSDDDLHASLVTQAAARPARSWDAYADDLWKALMT